MVDDGVEYCDVVGDVVVVEDSVVVIVVVIVVVAEVIVVVEDSVVGDGCKNVVEDCGVGGNVVVVEDLLVDDDAIIAEDSVISEDGVTVVEYERKRKQTETDVLLLFKLLHPQYDYKYNMNGWWQVITEVEFNCEAPQNVIISFKKRRRLASEGIVNFMEDTKRELLSASATRQDVIQ